MAAAQSKPLSRTPSWTIPPVMASPAPPAEDTSHLLGHPSPRAQLCLAALASIAWMSVSSWLIMINKSLLSGGFPYPMMLSGLGMAFSGVASYVACRMMGWGDPKRVITPRFYLTRILPVGALMAATLLCGNLAYLYLTVAFIQILKSFTPVITMAALFLAGQERPTKRLIAAVTCIAAGTALAAAGELNFSLTGVAIMLASEVFEACRLVMTQKMLTGLRFHAIEGLMYLAPACTLWLALGAFAFEFPLMWQSGAGAMVAANPARFALAGALGFCVNALAYIVIQAASSLTLKVLGTVKNSLVVLLGVGLLGEHVSRLQGFGYVVSVLAFGWYQQLKIAQTRGRPPPGVERKLTKASVDVEAGPGDKLRPGNGVLAV